MRFRKISAAIIAYLILILLIPASFDVAALADSGKPVGGKAITEQQGEEVVVTEIVSGPPPQEAEATGLDAAGGKDTVRNLGIVRADAGAGTTATNKGASAGTRSVGIIGSGGKDSISNNGILSSKASSNVTSLSLLVNVDGFTLPFMRKFPSVTGGSLAESFAAGILGGNGNDSVENTGIMTVESTSTAAAGSINVNLTGKNEKVLSKAIPAIWAVKPPVMKTDAPVKAVSEAVGIDGGRGDDRILSTGAMTVKASATSGAGALNMNLGNDARVNLSAEATATTSGIRAVEGNDDVVNQGALTIEASATAGAGAVSATNPTDRGIYGLPERPPANSKVQIPIFTVQEDLSGKATALATGIESGSAAARIVNSGPIVSKASATAAAGSIAVGVGDSVEGSVAALSRAESRGIRSGDGNDVVLNSGEQIIEAKAIAGAGSISVGLMGTNPEEATDPSKVKADASGTADSRAVGIETGSGDDLIASIAAMSVKASSTVGAGSVAVGIGGGADSNVSAEAIARAAGIRSGEGNDSIRNEGTLAVEAASIAGAGSIGVGVTEGGEGESATAKADASGKATATSVGISGGSGDDSIVNIAPIRVKAEATTGAGSVSVGVGMGAEGNVSAESTAKAAGIRGGDGNDSIRNEGTLAVEASSIAGAGSIGVSVSGADGTEGDSVAAKADASAKAVATSVGISGGKGDDAIVNIAPVNVKASATTGAGSISVGVGRGAEGNVSAESTARAAGIRGGEGNDTIRNEGALTVESTSIAGAGSIAVGVKNGGDDDQENTKETSTAQATSETSTAKADASGKANASSIGISGGSGDDAIVNVAPVNVKATSTVGAGSIAVGVGMGAEGNASADSTARAAGIRGGEGNDTIRNEGALTVESTSIAGASIGVGVSGNDKSSSADTKADAAEGESTAKADASAQATAKALGIGGGAGDDAIVNIAPLNVKAASTVGAGSISVGVGMGAEAKVSAEATARSAGIRGGEGNDTIRNEGALTVESTSIAGAGSIGVGVSGDDKNSSADAKADATEGESTAKADASAKATSTALGIGGGSGQDTIVNIAPMDVKASATTGAGSIAVGVGMGAEGNVSAESTARAAGIRGDDGNDSIRNEGTLTIEAKTIVGAGSIAVGVSGSSEEESADAKTDASGKAKAAAVGISGGSSEDSLVNIAPVNVKASSTVGAGSIGVSVGGDVEGNISAEATTRAAGIRGGGGADEIVNQGTLTVEAKSIAVAGSISVGVKSEDSDDQEKPPAPPKLETSSVKADAKAQAVAAAAGIDAGDGNNRITNTAPLAVTSTATTVAGSIAVSVSGFGGSEGEKPSGGEQEKPETPALELSSAKTDASAKADARGIGITAGSGSDTIASGGNISVEATSTAVAAGVSVNVAKIDKGLSGSAALADAGAEALATAIGIDGGDGDNRISNTAAIGAKATATAVGVGVSVDVGIAEKGATLGAAIADSSTTAEALSTGIRSGAGQDQVINTGVITPDAKANATAVSVGLTVTNADKGLAASAALADANARAVATARGIETGAGDDVILNEGAIAPKANAGTTAVGVTIGVGVTKEGVSLAASLAESNTTSAATAVGIDSGSGNDRVSNAGQITLDAQSSATAVSVGLSVTYAKQGVGASAAIVEAQSTADATARGIEAGEGGDRITNSGTIQGIARADTTSVGVAVGVGIAKQGVAIGVGLSDTSTTAGASSVGIDGGRGVDRIVNEGNINLGLESGYGSVADANAVSVSVTVAGASQGVAGAAALSKSTATGVAQTTGIYGGEGSDEIRNAGKIDVGAKADVDSTNVAVGVTVAKEGLAGGAALSDASALAAATAKGIDGAEEDDLIVNTGEIKARSESRADTVSVTAIIAGTKTGVAGGASLSNSSAQAIATARGIEAGAGDDRTRNDGEIDATAISGAKTTSVTVTVSGSLTGVAGGAALSDASAASLSDASGISGGDGGDEIANTAKISAQATSDVDTTAVTVTLSVTKEGVAAGAALSDTSSSAVSTARGIDGGAGSDRIWNEGVTEATSNAIADTTSVVVQVAGSLYGAAGGVSMSDSSAAAVAQSTGIAGRAGDDVIVNSSKVTARSTADVHATSVAVTVSGSIGLAAGAAFSDASVDSRAESRGLDGGDGNDVIVNTGEVVSVAGATGKSTSVSVNVALGAGGGATFSDSSALVSADASGIDGGRGHDRIYNSGPVTANASSDADVSSVAVTVGAAVSAGASFGDASVVSNAAARGIAGGEGNDEIYNEGKITSGAMSRVDADSVSVNVGMGWAEATTAVTSVTTASGIEGGGGDDRIVNKGEIHVGPSPGLDPWMSRIAASSFAFNLIGAANARSSMLATTKSTGIDGGAGNDSIRNEGLLNVLASSTSSVSGKSRIIFGASSGSVQAGAVAEALGVEGGAGDDTITNTAAITANSTTSVLLDSSSFSFGGTGDSGGLLTSTARATGISGGDGSDSIRNDGGLSLTASSSLTSRAKASVAFGTSGAASTSGSVTETTGISGGAGNDTITNTATITANSTASVLLDSSSFSFGGTGRTGGVLTATARSTGISGGDGSDSIRNDGSLSVTASSSLTSQANADVVFGSSSTGSTSGAVTEAIGISGGAGDDRIENHAAIQVTPSSNLTLSSSTFSFGGTGASGATLAATTSGTGITGGDGADIILNRGNITLRAGSTLTTGSSSNAAFGTSSGTVISGGVSQAVGIDGGAGDDRIWNAATLSVESSSTLTLKASGFTFGGTSGAHDALTADSRSVGISGGAGANGIRSEGAVTVTASSSLTAKADVDAAFGTTVTDGITSANSTATGISGGEKGDSIENLSVLTARAESSADIGNSTYVFGGTANAGGLAGTTARAVGIAAGDGDNRILNDLGGTVDVKASSTAKQSGSTTVTFGKPAAAADVKAEASAWGVTGGSGDDWIESRGTLMVDAYANADGGASAGAFWGSPRAIVYTRADATATGIDAGAGNNVIVNAGQLTVKAEAVAYGHSWAEEDAGDLATEEARATAIAASTAWGITTGDGLNLIENNGTINVTATATPTAVAETEDNDVERRSASGIAWAGGIKTGSGDDRIIIGEKGSLSVRAEATAVFGAAKTIAIGIDAGGGSDQIENRGSISVRADALALFGSAMASATGIDAGGGDNTVYNYGTLSVTAQPVAILGASDSRAMGILTGEGSDTIINAGKILTSQYTSLTETPGTAISTGGGNDRVFLEAGSETRGLIDLGSGDDTISFNGSLTVTGSVIGGAGINTVVFSGDGTLEAPISGFETAIKNGPGTYTLSSLAQVKRLEMNGGTLAVNHSYQMPADGVFRAQVNGDGSHGQFFVNGVAGLDGALSVVRGKGVFTNGTKFPILAANTVSGWFTSENLPAPSPLLSFKVTGFSNRVEVEALAKSVTTVATNPVQMQVAQMLDKAMATAKGSTAEMLGEFQSLPAQDIQKAFASLNPGIYDRFRKASLTASRENIRSLHNRLTALRLTHPDYSAAVQARTIANTMSLFMTGPDSGMDPDQAWQLGRISSAEARSGSWMSAFGQRGGFAGASGYAGYDYRMNGTVIGYDQRHGETLITGFSNGFNRGEVSIEDKMGLGSITGAASSIYSSWFDSGAYMEGALSMARNLYTNHRSIVVGSLSQSAASEHEGNLFTAYLSGGRYFDVSRWVVEPYASMLFTQTYEDGFQETGGGLSLRIHDDRTRSLSTDVGLRVARSYEVPFGKLIPEAGIAWIYDFQLDDRRITASFADVAGSEFSIPGEQTGRHGARFEAGLSWQGDSGLTASLKYAGEFRSGDDDQGVFGYLRYEF